MASIEEAAQKLDEKAERTERLSKHFEGINGIEHDSNVKESFLSKQIEEKDPQKVAGIDGGLLRKRYASADIVAVRAVAAVFSFENSLSAEYFPSKNPEPEFYVFDQQDNDGLERNAEQKRLESETSVCLKVLNQADTVLMDGSIVPSYLPDEDTVERYDQLFEKAENGQLVGVVEDSHGLKMAKLLEEKLGLDIGPVADTQLMDAVLEPGERSFVRRYSDSPVEHPVLQKLEDEKANMLKTFYVKLSDRDLPLRIDYFGTKEKADKIAGILLSLKSSESYTVPSPVLEADKRAKIPEKYLKRLEKRFSPDERRRDRRPFS